MTDTISKNDQESEIREQVAQAYAENTRLQICGGRSKSFYGHQVDAKPLEMKLHSGVIDYDPAELVITLRAGCKLRDIEALLAQNNQMFGFEPLQLGADSTIGGVVATGLAGPRRAWAGGVREFILGARILNGRGEVMNFGGRVIKNVAGFDVSRLMVGALGTLGVILEVSLRLIPKFETETTLGFEHSSSSRHVEWINQLGLKPLPLSASTWYAGRSFVRLSGSQQGVDSAVRQIGGEVVTDIWTDLRRQRHEFFDGEDRLLRLSVPQTCGEFLSGDIELIEWGGAQRWTRTNTDLEALRKKAEDLQASVCVYREGAGHNENFHRPAAPLMLLHRNLKSTFDPSGILNPGRLYPDL